MQKVFGDKLGCIGAYKYALKNHILDDLYPKEVD